MEPSPYYIFVRPIRKEGYDRFGGAKTDSGIILPFGHHSGATKHKVDKWLDRPRMGVITGSGIPFYQKGDTVILSHNAIIHETSERDEHLIDRDADIYWLEPQLTHGRVRNGEATPYNETSVFVRMGPTPMAVARHLDDGIVHKWETPTMENQPAEVIYDREVLVHNMGHVFLGAGDVIMVAGGPKPRHQTAECGELTEIMSHQILARLQGDTWVPFDTHIWVDLPKKEIVGGIHIPGQLASAYRGRDIRNPSRLAIGTVVGAGIKSPYREGDEVIVNDINKFSIMGFDAIPADKDHVYARIGRGA